MRATKQKTGYLQNRTDGEIAECARKFLWRCPRVTSMPNQQLSMTQYCSKACMQVSRLV